MDCNHDKQVAGIARYDRENRMIRYHTQCEGCGMEWLKSVSDPYTPNFLPHKKD